MPVYRPSELRQFLNQISALPKKHLSQNFLIDGNILRKIVADAEVQPNENILEIGPGPGALTECLLEAGANVFAVEKDPILAKELRRLGSEEKLKIFESDILKFSFTNELKYPTKVIANLPYHLTAPILGLLVPQSNLFTSIWVMVQDEVAKRMTAVPGNKDYSSLTLFLNFYSDPSYRFKVNRQSFFPVPKVDSAVVRLVLKPTKNIDPLLFFQLVHKAFGQRRKMLKVSLKEYGSSLIENLLKEIGCNPKSRPEKLSLEEWIHLFEKLFEA